MKPKFQKKKINFTKTVCLKSFAENFEWIIFGFYILRESLPLRRNTSSIGDWRDRYIVSQVAVPGSSTAGVRDFFAIGSMVNGIGGRYPVNRKEFEASIAILIIRRYFQRLQLTGSVISVVRIHHKIQIPISSLCYAPFKLQSMIWRYYYFPVRLLELRIAFQFFLTFLWTNVSSKG